MASKKYIKLRARLMRDEEIAFGPGKADLLAAIDRTGSISAAARDMGMSYRRAWLLVDTMNRCFRSPLGDSAPGGKHGGGARLTDTGRRVRQRYLEMEDALRALADEFEKDLKKDLG